MTHIFTPKDLVIEAGDCVRFVNIHEIEHSAVALDRTFNTGTLMPRSSSLIRFDAPGELPYWCGLHPPMVGTIVVRAEAINPPSSHTGPVSPQSHQCFFLDSPLQRVLPTQALVRTVFYHPIATDKGGGPMIRRSFWIVVALTLAVPVWGRQMMNFWLCRTTPGSGRCPARTIPPTVIAP